MSGPDTRIAPPPLTTGDLPVPGALPDALVDRLLEEVQQCAAYTPVEQLVLFQWAIWNLAAILLGHTGPAADISALDPRIRRALFVTVDRMVMLFPRFRRQIGVVLRTFVTLVDEGLIIVGVTPLDPLGGG